MFGFDQVIAIAIQNKWRVLFTYTLLLTEFIIFALIPFFVGKAIDSLVVREFYYFSIYLSLSISGFFIGFFRRRVDTRTFSKIWEIRTLDAIKSLSRSKIDSTKIISRANLARTYGDFLEFTLPTILHAIIEIGIASVMLWLVVPSTTLIIIPLVVIAIVSQYLFSIVLRKIEVELQTTREDVDHKIVQKDIPFVESGYDSLRKLYIRASDLEATCWGMVHLLGVGSVILVVFALLDKTQTAGSILIAISYAQTLFNRTNVLNFLFSHIRQMQVAEQFLSEKNDEELAAA